MGKIDGLCRWTQGYICAVCVMINFHKGVDSEVRELYRSAVGNIPLKELKAQGIDQRDLKTLRKYWKELQK